MPPKKKPQKLLKAPPKKVKPASQINLKSENILFTEDDLKNAGDDLDITNQVQNLDITPKQIKEARPISEQSPLKKGTNINLEPSQFPEFKDKQPQNMDDFGNMEVSKMPQKSSKNKLDPKNLKQQIDNLSNDSEKDSQQQLNFKPKSKNSSRQGKRPSYDINSQINNQKNNNRSSNMSNQLLLPKNNNSKDVVNDQDMNEFEEISNTNRMGTNQKLVTPVKSSNNLNNNQTQLKNNIEKESNIMTSASNQNKRGQNVLIVEQSKETVTNQNLNKPQRNQINGTALAKSPPSKNNLNQSNKLQDLEDLKKLDEKLMAEKIEQDQNLQKKQLQQQLEQQEIQENKIQENLQDIVEDENEEGQIIVKKQKKPKVEREKYSYKANFSILKGIAICCESLSRLCLGTHHKLQKLGKKIDNKTAKLKEKSKNMVNLTSEYIVIIAFMIITCIFYIAFTSDSSSITEPKGFHEAKQYTANRLISGSLIFTFYGIFFLQIERYIYLYILFLGQCMPSIFVFLYYGYAAYVTEEIEINNKEIINSAFAFGIYLFWLATWLIQEDLKKFTSRKVVSFFIVFWCILVGAVLAGYTIYLTSTTFELNFAWGHKLIQALAGPYILLISLIWVYIHFRYFQPLIIRKKYEDNDLVRVGLKKLQDEEELLPIMEKDTEKDKKIKFDSDINLDEINFDKSSENQSSKLMKEGNALGVNRMTQPDFDTIDQQEENKQNVGNMENQMQDQQQQQQQEEEKIPLTGLQQKEKNDKAKKIIYQNILVSFTSMVLGGTMLFLTILSILYLGHHLSKGELKNYENPQSFFMNLFMIISIPLTIILSTVTIFAKVSEKLKLILIPIFGAMIPLLFSVPLSLVIDYFVETRSLRRFFALGPAGVCLWIITLIYIKVDRWRLSMFFNSYVCLFFLVPFFYILPLRSNDTWLTQQQVDDGESSVDDDISQVTFIGLLVAGIGLIFIVFSFRQVLSVYKTWQQHKNRKKPKTQSQKELEQYEANEFVANTRFELSNIFIYDLQFFGLWGNALGYILTFTILIYMYYYSPDYVSDASSGILLGLQVTIIFLFFACLIILLMTIISEKKKDAVSFSEQISSMSQSKHGRALLIERQRKVRWSVVRFAILENSLFCLMMMIIFWSKEELRWTFLIMMIGIYIVGAIFCQLYITKRNFDDFSKTAVPALIVFSWIFLYLPFSGVVPVSIMLLSEDDEENVNLERLVFGSTTALLLTGILLLGLLAHLYFKRREFERKFKFIASKVIKKLAKNHVKSDYSSVSLAYQGYVSKEKEEAIKYMSEGNLINSIEISKYNPDLRFSKMIIDSGTFKNLENKRLGKVNQQEKIKKIIDWIMKYYCCYTLCQKEKKNKVLDEENANLLSDDDGEDGDINDHMDRANQQNVKRMEEVDLEDEEDPFIKALIKNQEAFGVYGDIIEPLRRYDLSQNLQISKPFQSEFIKHIFKLFAQGSNKRYDMPWIDYIMFKQLLILSHIVPSREFPDYFIDKLYGKYTNYEKMANQNPITENRFTFVLSKIAVIKYPYDPEEHALGKLVKFWLFPYLLWYIKPLHGLYPHEWDYVLFLLKFYGHKENHDTLITNDVNFRRDLEKYLGINQEKEYIEEDNDKKEGWSWARFKKWLREWCISFCDNWLYFIKSHMLTDRDMWEPELDEVEIEVKMVNNTILKPVPFANKRKKIFKHDESPAWPKVVELMMDEMKQGEIDYMKLKDAEFAHIKIRNRISNYLLLIFKVIEYFALGSLAFTPSIDWGFSAGVLDLLNFFNTLSPGFSYGVYFVITFIAVFYYLFVNYRSVIRIRLGIFGNSESNRKNKKLCSFDFLFVTSTNFISMVMGFLMLKTLFDAFACDYSIKPQTMYQDDLQECFTGTHNTYFALSIICLLIYLPEITYLWPNIQYQNRAQDIRYDPTHQTIAQSAKVLIACTSAFFAHPDDAVYFLGISAFILMMFGVLTRKMKPCLVKIINPLEMGGYYAAGWMHISAIVCNYSSAMVGFIVMGCGFLIILLISLGYWKILHDLQIDNKRKKKIKATNENGEEIEIEVDINSDDEEEEEERRRKREKEESYEYKIWKKTKAFKDFKEEKKEWLDEDLIPYKDEDESIVEDEQQDGVNKDNEIQSKNGDQNQELLPPLKNNVQNESQDKENKEIINQNDKQQ